jgi:citrate synthase
VDDVTIDQAYGGMRDITSMIWEPSLLDAEEGIRFRGYSIPELREKLPRAPTVKSRFPKDLFWLMLVGEIPTKEQVKWLTENWVRRANVPEHVFRAIDALPVDSPPDDPTLGRHHGHAKHQRVCPAVHHGHEQK